MERVVGAEMGMQTWFILDALCSMCCVASAPRQVASTSLLKGQRSLLFHL